MAWQNSDYAQIYSTEMKQQRSLRTDQDRSGSESESTVQLHEYNGKESLQTTMAL